MKRRISEEERKLWRTTMRGVTPLRDWTSATVANLTEQKPVASQKLVKEKTLRLPVAVKLRENLPSPGARLAAPRFDFESERRLKAGQLHVEARLDLHGMTENKAHKAVLDFVAAAIAARHRMVLVVTGKGVMGEGVLNRNLSLWLEAAPAALRHSIQTVRPASLRDGGGGAYYLLLKKKRP